MLGSSDSLFIYLSECLMRPVTTLSLQLRPTSPEPFFEVRLVNRSLRKGLLGLEVPGGFIPGFSG